MHAQVVPEHVRPSAHVLVWGSRGIHPAQTIKVRFGTQTSQPIDTDYFIYNHVYASWVILGKPSEVLVLRGRIRREAEDGGGTNEGLRLDAFNVSLTPIEGTENNFYSRV